MKKIKTATELLDDLGRVYAELRNGELGMSVAKTAANVAGKMTGVCKTKIEYNKMIQSKSTIPFLED